MTHEYLRYSPTLGSQPVRTIQATARKEGNFNDRFMEGGPP